LLLRVSIILWRRSQRQSDLAAGVAAGVDADELGGLLLPLLGASFLDFVSVFASDFASAFESDFASAGAASFEDELLFGA
jgi:hypothetical protein